MKGEQLAGDCSPKSPDDSTVTDIRHQKAEEDMADKALTKTIGRAKVLKDNGWTKPYMQREWNRVVEAVEAGCWGPVKAFIDDGYNWDNLPLHLIPQVPGLADRMMESKAKKDAEKAAEEQQRQDTQNSRQYYYDHMEEILLAKIDRGEELNEDEIADLVDNLPHYDEECGDNRRWSRSVTTYLRTQDGRFFRVDWEQGLTESQENSYWEQPVEVTLHEEEQTVVVIQRTWTEVSTGKTESTVRMPA